jgi:hypothetical protein
MYLIKILLPLSIALTSVNAFKIEKEVKIGKHIFNLVKESYNEYGDKGVSMALYDVNKSTTHKLSFLLGNESGDCTDKNIEDGNYKIQENKIVFYTHWRRARSSNYMPRGDRIQVYQVDDNGAFKMIDSKVYVEKTRQNEDADEGMKYLFTAPTNEAEKLLLKEYKISVEKKYNAKFVKAEQAKYLVTEVKKALKEKHSSRWD